MTPDQAIRRLREALADRDIPTLDVDVAVLGSGYPTLSLAQGVVVSVGPEFLRWPDPDNGWAWHPIDDPSGAAHRLAHYLAGDPVFKLRRQHPGWTILRVAGTGRYCAAPAAVALSSAPAVEAETPDRLSVLIYRSEATCPAR